MNFLLPQQNQIQKFGRKKSNTDIFLFSTTHGYAHLGFRLNKYSFISAEQIEQDLVANSDAKWEYMYEFLRDRFGNWEGEYNSDRVIENLLNYRLIFAQSAKPLTQREINVKIQNGDISKFDKLNNCSHWVYTCGIRLDLLDSLDSLEEAVRYGEVDMKDYWGEFWRRIKKDFKKKHFQNRLNAFQSLDLLTQNLIGDVEFKGDFSSVQKHYGRITEYKEGLIPHSQPKKTKEKTSINFKIEKSSPIS